MRLPLLGNKRAVETIPVFNADTAIIPAGTPVVWKATSGSLTIGVDVILPATAGAALSSVFFAGVAVRDIPIGQFGEATAYGFVTNALTFAGTAIAKGDSLVVDNITNKFIRSAAAAQSPNEMTVIAVTVNAGATVVGTVFLSTM